MRSNELMLNPCDLADVPHGINDSMGIVVTGIKNDSHRLAGRR
jgi:hypothetical protein